MLEPTLGTEKLRGMWNFGAGRDEIVDCKQNHRIPSELPRMHPNHYAKIKNAPGMLQNSVCVRIVQCSAHWNGSTWLRTIYMAQR
jgi:hypothetical protein